MLDELGVDLHLTLVCDSRLRSLLLTKYNPILPRHYQLWVVAMSLYRLASVQMQLMALNQSTLDVKLLLNLRSDSNAYELIRKTVEG